MSRTKMPFQLRRIHVAATQCLTSEIGSRSGLPLPELEETLAIGSDGFKESRSGMQWRRYQAGRRVLCPVKRDRIAREAFLRGWLPDDRLPTKLEELLAWGSIRKFVRMRLEGQPVTRRMVEEDRREWLAWYRLREQVKVAERRTLQRLKGRSVRELEMVMSMMAGAGSLRGIEVFIAERLVELNDLFGTRWRKAPSWVGIRQFLLRLDENELENAVRSFAQRRTVAPAGRQFIALDGKALRGSASRLDDMAARHIVSAFDRHGLIVLGHVEVAEKSNEIPAAQALIESLGLPGRVFTMDALHCQKKR